MSQRKWNSLHPDTLYGDAAARVLCRLFRAEPSGRTLQQCLDKVEVEPSPEEAFRNALEGDGTFAGVGIECKAAIRPFSANVCMSPFEMNFSKAVILAAWVPQTDEICWFATMHEVRKAKFWLENNGTWLIARDAVASARLGSEQ